VSRRDLEEAITNLEYLVVNHYDPEKVEDYEQQLLEFRRELFVIDRFEELSSGVFTGSQARQ
jgi:hypothetical protein